MSAPAAVPAPVTPAPPEPAPPAAPAFVPPVPLAPLVLPWPADVPAPAEAVPAIVEVELLVDEAGAVESVTLVTGDEPFAAAALAAMKAVRFTPAMEEGVAVAVQVPVRLEIAPPPINVDGVVRYAGDAPAPAVGVLVSVGGQSVRTDEAGRFAFRGVPDGDQVLTVVTPEPVKVDDKPLLIGEGEAVHLELWARTPEVPAGVIGFYRRERDEVVRRTITAEELRTLPGTMGDPLRAISNLPGAVRTPLDAGWLLVRGGDPRDTGVYIDGARVPLIYHLGGFTSVVHPGFIDRVDFYPGGQSARYGRATAGAVDLLTRARPEKVEARVGANIVLASAYAAAPLGKLGGISGGIRRSYLDGVLGLVPGITKEQAQVAPRFFDWAVRGDYGPASVLGLGYFDTIDASTADGNRAQVTMLTNRLHGSLRLEVLGKALLIKPHYAYEKNILEIDVLERVQTQERNGGGGRIEFADDGEGLFGWSAGVDTSFDWFGMELNGQQLYAHVDSPDAYADVRIGEKIRGVVGLRLDTLFVSRQLPRAAPSPRMSVVVPIGDIVTLVGDAGLYHQPPPADMLVGPPEGSTLAMEQSYGGGGGVRIDYGPWQVGIDAYSRKIARITAYEADGSLGQIEGQASGVETMVRYSTARLSGWVAYSYGHSQRREEPADAWYPSNYDQPHTLVAVASTDLGKRWTLGGRWRFASGFPVPATEDPIEAYDVLGQTAVTLVPDRFGRTEAFHGLDVKISKQAQYKHWRLEYYLDVQNLYNRRVAEPVISGVWEAYGTQTYGFGLPILPILGIEAIFGG
ncbi:MAG: TonB-dependent receptor [Pseudomonadota bacterium]|nr:TonB-dependent receptor [Pseudomonadota bacterium]